MVLEIDPAIAAIVIALVGLCGTLGGGALLAATTIYLGVRNGRQIQQASNIAVTSAAATADTTEKIHGLVNSNFSELRHWLAAAVACIVALVGFIVVALVGAVAFVLSGRRAKV